MELPVSLAASGKSRADLWSFASSVAVEWGLDRNNKAGMIIVNGKEEELNTIESILCKIIIPAPRAVRERTLGGTWPRAACT